MASRGITTLADAINAIHQINSILDKMNIKQWDFHGRRIVNAAPSVDPLDYVVQKELLAGLGGITLALGIFISKINSAIMINNGSVTIQPGTLRILDDKGKPYVLTPVLLSGIVPTDFVVKADLL